MILQEPPPWLSWEGIQRKGDQHVHSSDRTKSPGDDTARCLGKDGTRRRRYARSGGPGRKAGADAQKRRRARSGGKEASSAGEAQDRTYPKRYGAIAGTDASRSRSCLPRGPHSEGPALVVDGGMAGRRAAGRTGSESRTREGIRERE